MKDYNPKEAENKWQNYWEKEKIYKFDSKSKKPIFSIDTPPPTVSGKMHLGHAFSYAQQDFTVRYKRMAGYNIFYPFGTDDNGLATIRLIEKEKKVKAFDLGREKFISLVLETLEKELRPRYLEDWKKLGMSCEWDIFYTTIDKHCQKISQRSFIDLYKKGREYRKRTPFFWCTECQTAISQVELKDKTQKSKFVYMKFDTDLNEPITIATTRPELMAACVGIFVHPDDKRYKKFIGHKAKLPFYNRELEIKTNKDVAMDFGSGCVYHCSFGDAEDIEWMEREKIKPIGIVNKDGKLNKKAGKYEGLTIKQARETIIKDLQAANKIEKIEDIEHVVNTHERCGTDIEILMTDQWFIKYLDLKPQMIKWGKKLNWYPSYMRVRYDNWVKGLKWDWCISRQRFFGIPFPVWYCKKCKKIILADEKQLPVDPLKDKPNKPCKCGSTEFIPEKDVLDTWATSSLTPQLAVELMPNDQQKTLFPMSLRPQAHDIITFWLFNTVVKSQLHYQNNPWKDVMISGFVLDPHGKKMSKSKGNVIEPQDIIEKYSADALRFWAASSKLGSDLPYKEKEILAGQKFIIKLWNASKFVFMHLKDYKDKKPKQLEAIDSYILSKLQTIIKNSTNSFNKYGFYITKTDTENFFWHTFCDNYLEIIKDRLYNPDKRGKQSRLSAQYTLNITLLTILKLMAPIMPYITEELYQTYFKKQEKEKSIHITNWPIVNKKLINKDIEIAGKQFIDILSQVRQFKSKHNKSLKTPVRLIIPEDLDKAFLDDLKAATQASEIKYGKLKISF